MPVKSTLPQVLKLEKQVCFPLYSAANAMVRAYRPLLDKLDLTYLQYLVMMVLWENDGINVKELGHRLYLDSGTLTPMLKRMEAKGYVLRKRGEADERVRELYLTEAGKQLQEKALSIPEAMACKVAMAPEEQKQLKSLCETLLTQIEEG
ncbi:MarR family winged helix-turn-helix transcriptional regulator [Algicola sagamiensis]|uniref:MarR family winged helix-turn-helix transcriptional regulator n=1 Tax=Algicola sagamiensis TaxID=163869 RepID=UPI0003671037|nr:MarR family transcriptional regulator [Algicola sagamiensis]